MPKDYPTPVEQLKDLTPWFGALFGLALWLAVALGVLIGTIWLIKTIWHAV